MTTRVQIPRTQVKTQALGRAPTIPWGGRDKRTLARASLWSSQIYELQVQEDFISKNKLESEERYWPLTSKHSNWHWPLTSIHSYWHWPLTFIYSRAAISIYMCSHSWPLLPSPNTPQIWLHSMFKLLKTPISAQLSGADQEELRNNLGFQGLGLTISFTRSWLISPILYLRFCSIFHLKTECW